MTVIFISKADDSVEIEVEMLLEPVIDPETRRAFNVRYRPIGEVLGEAEQSADSEPEPEPEPEKFIRRRRKKKAEVEEVEAPEPTPEDEWTYTTLGILKREYRPASGADMKELISPTEEEVA